MEEFYCFVYLYYLLLLLYYLLFNLKHSVLFGNLYMVCIMFDSAVICLWNDSLIAQTRAPEKEVLAEEPGRAVHPECSARGGGLQNLIYKNMAGGDSLCTRRVLGMPGKKPAVKAIEIYLKYCCWSVQTLQTECPVVEALTNLLTSGVLLVLQYQVMFVQLEAADCDLAGKKRMPNLAGSFLCPWSQEISFLVILRNKNQEFL